MWTFAVSGAWQRGGSVFHVQSTASRLRRVWRWKLRIFTDTAFTSGRSPQSKLRKELSTLWTEIRGERSFVSISARGISEELSLPLNIQQNFNRFSAGAFGRIGGHVPSIPHPFSTGAAFYAIKSTREPGEDSSFGECPLCGARLIEIVQPWVPRFVLESEGRRDVGLVDVNFVGREFCPELGRDAQFDMSNGASRGVGNEHVHRRQTPHQRVTLLRVHSGRRQLYR